MRGKLWFFGGLAAGFVLGARAGREKYDELVRNARRAWDHPTVQEAAGVVQAQASRLYAEGKETVSDKLSHTRVGERLATRTRREGQEEPEALAGARAGTEPPPAAAGRSNNTTTF